MASTRHEITRLLEEWSAGDPQALDRLMPLVFDDLRQMARRYLAGESPAHTLQPTALVNEVYLRLEGRRRVSFRNRRHFFGSLAELIRRILVDHARRQKSPKRGGDATKSSLEVDRLPSDIPSAELLALDDALRDLEKIDPRQYRIVTLKFFAGLTWPEVAEVLEVSRATAERQWRIARMWLLRQLDAAETPP